MDPLVLSVEKLLPQARYDAYNIPPNLNTCKAHYKATTFGPCPCCWQKEKRKLGICCSLKQIEQVEPTTSYFFFLIKSMICLIITVLLVYGVFSFTSTVVECRNKPEKCIYIYGIPFLKVNDESSAGYKVLSVATTLIVSMYVVLLQYFLLRRQNKYLDMVRPGDYSIMLSGVDHQKVSRQDLAEFFANEGIKDIQILYTHKIGKYLQAERQKALLKSKLQYCISKGVKGEEVEKFKHKIRAAESELHLVTNKFYFNQEQSLRSDKIFVSFQNFEDREKIIQKYNQGVIERLFLAISKKPSRIVIKDTYIVIQQLPQPNQINWGNLEIKSLSRYFRILLGNVITFVMLFIAFILTLYISNLEVSEENFNVDDKLYAYMCATGIAIVNVVLSVLVHLVARKERRSTKPGMVNGLMMKQTISFFISTALIPVSMFFIYHKVQDSESLISNVISILTVNSFITSVALLINIEGIYRYFMRSKISSGGAMLTQYQAQGYFEKTDFELDYKFALVAKLSFLALFYGGAFPLGFVWSLFGLSIYYWTLKYMLIKHSRMVETSFKIPKRMNKLLCLMPMVFTSGQWSNQFLINNSLSKFNFILFCCSVLLTLLLIGYSRQSVKYFMKKYSLFTISKKPPRSEAIKRGMIDYRHVNPTSYEELGHRDLSVKVYSPQQLSSSQQIPESGGLPVPEAVLSLSLYFKNNPRNI